MPKSVITTNKKITTADGITLDVVSVNELNAINGISDANMIEIVVSNETDDTYNKILEFLNGDLFTIKYEADLNYVNDDRNQHYEYDMYGYMCEPDVSYGRVDKQYNTVERYYIILKQPSDSNIAANSSKADIENLYEAIAEEYEKTV